MNKFSYTAKVTLKLDKEEFLRFAVPKVLDIDSVIKEELMQTGEGIIHGILPAGWSWERMFYLQLVDQGKINLTPLGKERFGI